MQKKPEEEKDKDGEYLTNKSNNKPVKKQEESDNSRELRIVRVNSILNNSE